MNNRVVLKFCGIEVDKLLDYVATFDRPNVIVSIIGQYLDNKVVIERKCGSCSDMEELIFNLMNEFASYFYTDQDILLSQYAVNLLNGGTRNLAVAESLTGGLISSELVAINGVSLRFIEGVVTYSNESKTNRLGVDKQIIEKFGAVSEPVARMMAQGLLHGNIGITLSTTGIAGPTGHSQDKPLGLTYIGIESEDISIVYKHIFAGDRESIRNSAKNMALFYLVKYLRNELVVNN